MPIAAPESLIAVEAMQKRRTRASYEEADAVRGSEPLESRAPAPVSTGLMPGSPKELVALETKQLAMSRATYTKAMGMHAIDGTPTTTEVVVS